MACNLKNRNFKGEKMIAILLTLFACGSADKSQTTEAPAAETQTTPAGSTEVLKTSGTTQDGATTTTEQATDTTTASGETNTVEETTEATEETTEVTND